MELSISSRLNSNCLRMLLFWMVASLLCLNLTGILLNSLYCFDKNEFIVFTYRICPETYMVPTCEIIFEMNYCGTQLGLLWIIV